MATTTPRYDAPLLLPFCSSRLCLTLSSSPPSSPLRQHHINLIQMCMDGADMGEPGATKKAQDMAMRMATQTKKAVATERNVGGAAAAAAGASLASAAPAAASHEPRHRKRARHVYPTASGIAPRSPDRSAGGILARISSHASPCHPSSEGVDPLQIKITAEGYAFTLDDVSASPPLPPFRISFLTQLYMHTPLLPLLLLYSSPQAAP